MKNAFMNLEKKVVVVIIAEMAVLGLTYLAVKDYREMRNDIREIKEKLRWM